MFLKPFKGKHILISGGGTGLGLAIAKAYAAEGAHLALIDSNKESLLQAQREIQEAGLGTRCLIFSAPPGDGKVIRDFVNMIHYEFGTIDGIIACPSPIPQRSLYEFDHTEIDTHIDTHLKGALHIARAAIPLITQHHEHVGGFIGIVAPFGREFSITAAMSQEALYTFTQCLRVEHKRDRMRIHLLVPPVEILKHKQKSISRKFIKGIAKHRKTITYGFTTRPRRFLLQNSPLIWKILFGRYQSVIHEEESIEESYHQPASPVKEKTPPTPEAKQTPKQEPAKKAAPPKEPVQPTHEETKTTEKPTPPPTKKPSVTTAAPNGFTVYNETLLKGVCVSMEIDDIKPFLNTITKYVSTFDIHIPEILTGIAPMDLDSTQSWEYEVEYEDRNIPFQIDITINKHDVITANFYTTPKLALVIDQEFERRLSA